MLDGEPFFLVIGKPKEAGAEAISVAMMLAASFDVSSSSRVLGGCCASASKNSEDAVRVEKTKQTRPDPVRKCAFLELCHNVLPHVRLHCLRLVDLSVKNVANDTPDGASSSCIIVASTVFFFCKSSHALLMPSKAQGSLGASNAHVHGRDS